MTAEEYLKYKQEQNQKHKKRYWRDVYKSREKRRESYSRYYAKNKEKVLARGRRFANSERGKAWRASYRIKNHKHIKRLLLDLYKKHSRSPEYRAKKAHYFMQRKYGVYAEIVKQIWECERQLRRKNGKEKQK